MATIQWVVLAHHKKADGTYNPKIQITHKRSTAYMSTGIYTSMVRFRKGTKQGVVTDGSIEDSLNDKVKKIREIINAKSEIVDGLGSAKEVKDLLLRSMEAGKTIDLFVFADKFIERINVEGTRVTYVTRVNALKRYMAESTGSISLPIVNVTKKFLEGYEAWLLSRRVRNGVMKRNTAIGYINAISFILNAAKAEYNDYDSGDIVIQNDPFKSYRPPRLEEVRKRSISVESVRRIYEYSSKSKLAMLARDVFLISFLLAGMNLADMFECSPFTDRIEYTRKKTRNRKKTPPFLSLKIHPVIADFVDKYRDDTKERGFAFHRMYKNADSMHGALRIGIAKMRNELGIPGLTLYSARHSFATIARNDCNVSMDDIAMCLTHESGFNMTDVYVKPDFSRVDKVIDKVAKYVFG